MDGRRRLGGRYAFWRDGKIDVLARSSPEPLNLRRRNWNLKLDEFGVWYGNNCRKTSDSVQFSADDVEDEKGEGLNNVQPQWFCVEEEEW